MKIRLLATLFLVAFAAMGFAESAEAPLTNADVLELAEAGLSEELIVAKIKQAGAVAFALEAPDLVALKDKGLSDAVVHAMLDRTAPPAAPPAFALPPGVAARQAANPWARGIRLISSDGARDLQPHHSSYSSSGFSFVRLRFLNVDGLHSPTRTRDANCLFEVNAEHDPSTSNEFRLVRFEVDEDDRVRSVKLGRAMTDEFSSQRAAAPDPDWVVEVSSVSVGPGTYRLTPRAPLTPGEYGVLVAGYTVYDFGVD